MSNRVKATPVWPSVAVIELMPSGRLIIRPKPGRELKLSNQATLHRQRGGSFIIEAFSKWLSVSQAAALLGVSKDSVLRLCDFCGQNKQPFLISRRPTPMRIEVLLQSVIRHSVKTQSNPRFWDSCKWGLRHSADLASNDCRPGRVKSSGLMSSAKAVAEKLI